MGYKFGTGSQGKLNTCHNDLIKIMQLAISRSDVDFGVSEGHRSLERQHQLFLEGKSKIDGITRKGKHNYFPSMAVDIFSYHPDLQMRRKIVYDRVHLGYIGGVITSCAKELLDKGEVSHRIRLGMNWDMDGIIDYDQPFDDYPHIELV